MCHVHTNIAIFTADLQPLFVGSLFIASIDGTWAPNCLLMQHSFVLLDKLS